VSTTASADFHPVVRRAPAAANRSSLSAIYYLRVSWITLETIGEAGIYNSYATEETGMPREKAKKKAVKKIDKAVRKAVRKGVAKELVTQTVDQAIVKSAKPKASKKAAKKQPRSGKLEPKTKTVPADDDVE
jgi:hypothetical protein